MNWGGLARILTHFGPISADFGAISAKLRKAELRSEISAGAGGVGRDIPLPRPAM